MNLKLWKQKLEQSLIAEMDSDDGAHDISHMQRVCHTALAICKNEGNSSPETHLTILAASLFHDLIALPKNHPERHLSSLYAAKKTEEILSQLDFPHHLIPKVCHAIHAHSFTAKVTPQTLEARCVQDADRLESLGALGILRAFYVAGKLQTQLYHPVDPLGKERPFDDKTYALDHFEVKLLKLQHTMTTRAGKKIAEERSQFLETFRKALVIDKNPYAQLIAEQCYKNGKNSSSLDHGFKELPKLTDPFTISFYETLQNELNTDIS